jgi:hypothetical protein
MVGIFLRVSFLRLEKIALIGHTTSRGSCLGYCGPVPIEGFAVVEAIIPPSDVTGKNAFKCFGTCNTTALALFEEAVVEEALFI